MFLKALSLRQLDLLADYMEQQYFSDNQSIITEGELGTHMYVLADGLLEVRKDKRILKVIKEGEVFGELAILYHCKGGAVYMEKVYMEKNLEETRSIYFEPLLRELPVSLHAKSVEYGACRALPFSTS